MPENATMSAHENNGLLPAQAFGEAYPQQLSPGELFKFRGNWSMRVAYSEREVDQAFLILQGPNAGQLHRAGQGMARALCIVSPFTWFAVVPSDDVADHDALHTASLAIAEIGPVIIGGDSDGDHYGFGLDGQRWSDYPSQAARTRFDRWSAQLALKERPFRSLGTLFFVDRRAGRTDA